jgi:hypothetical protein
MMAEADFTRKDLQDMFSTMAENLKKDSEESMKTMEENLKSAITTKTNDNYKSLKLDLARNTNIVSTLVEYVSRGKIKNLVSSLCHSAWLRISQVLCAL